MSHRERKLHQRFTGVGNMVVSYEEQLLLVGYEVEVWRRYVDDIPSTFEIRGRVWSDADQFLASQYVGKEFILEMEGHRRVSLFIYDPATGAVKHCRGPVEGFLGLEGAPNIPTSTMGVVQAGQVGVRPASHAKDEHTKDPCAFNPTGRGPLSRDLTPMLSMPESETKPVELLLIEDNPADVVLIWHVLAESGFKVKVHIATDGQQALQMLMEPRFVPNLIVLDLNIPKIPGLNLLERWRGKTPVVVFSSSTNEREKQRAMELGASEFVGKSTDFTEFTESVCGMVRKWGGVQ
jgi:CheY-like chemotaxis protein